jgi:hypothetical protein
MGSRLSRVSSQGLSLGFWHVPAEDRPTWAAVRVPAN